MLTTFTNEKSTSEDEAPAEGADFTGARFDGLADFTECTFSHKVSFAAAVFVSGWSFANSVFRGVFTSFESAIFYGIHGFIEASGKGTDEFHFYQAQFLSRGDGNSTLEIKHDCHEESFVGSMKVTCGTSFRGARFDFNTLASRGFNHATFDHFVDFTE